MSDNGVGRNRVGHNWVSNDWVGRSHFNCWSVLRGAAVADILNDSISIVGVGHSQDTAVREVDCVAAGGGVTVSLLGLGEAGSAVVISNSVLVGVHWGLSEVTISIASSGRVSHQDSSRKSGGNSEESSSKENLHIVVC